MAMVRAEAAGTVWAEKAEEVEVEVVEVMLEVAEVEEALVAAEWARKAARKLPKKVRLVGIWIVVCMVIVSVVIGLEVLFRCGGLRVVMVWVVSRLGNRNLGWCISAIVCTNPDAHGFCVH